MDLLFFWPFFVSPTKYGWSCMQRSPTRNSHEKLKIHSWETVFSTRKNCFENLTRKDAWSFFDEKKVIVCFLSKDFPTVFLLLYRSLSTIVTTHRQLIVVGHDLSLAHRCWKHLIVDSSFSKLMRLSSNTATNHSVGTDVAAFLLFPESSAREKFEAKIILLQ